MEPSITGSIIAAASGLGGAGSGFAVFRHFATKWAEEREAADRKNAEDIVRVAEQLVDFMAVCTAKSVESERAGAVIKAELQTELRTAVSALRDHADSELLRVSNKNHELSNTLGVLMNEMGNQKRVMADLTASVEKMGDKIAQGTLAITSLTGRLMGAGLLRRSGDDKTEAT